MHYEFDSQIRILSTAYFFCNYKAKALGRYKMNALQAIKTANNVAFTENGDKAYATTNSACLDLFSLCGGMRNNIDNLRKLFVKAYGENAILAIKILFYMRNIRGGLGERNSFRVLLKELATYYPTAARQIVYAVPEYGRWDDLLVLLETEREARRLR